LLSVAGSLGQGVRWVYMIKKKEKESYKRQASSSKQRLTMVQGSCRMYIERYIMDNEQLKRIADAIEEILRLVKKDQEDSAARQRQNDNE